jgi:hypothetical protein
MMTDKNNTTAVDSEYTAPKYHHYELPPTPNTNNHHYSQTPRRQNNSATLQMTTPPTISSGRKQQQHTRGDGSSASLWGLPPPPPSTPRTPAVDNYYAMFGADIEQQQQQLHQEQEGTTSARRCCFCPGVNMVYNFCYWYSTQMDTHPVRTKSLTGGLTSIIGDVVAQVIENNTAIRTIDTNGIHWARVLAMFVCGLTYGPILHYTYELYEYILPIDACISIDEIIDAKCGGPSACGGGVDGGDISNGNSFDDHSIQQDSKNGGDEQVVSPPSMDNNDDDNVPLPSSTIIDDYSTSIPPTYFCHSTMFHSYYTLSHRRYVNAFLHVVIDQGIMQIFYVALMMLITGIIEGRVSTLASTFQEDYTYNVHSVWFAALTVLGPIQMMCFRFLSLKWRALSVSILDVLEVTIMSYIAHRNVDVPTTTTAQ